MNALNTEIIRDPFELVRRLGLPRRLAADAVEAAADYPMAFPTALLDRVVPCDANDPILRQFFPRPEEMVQADGFSADPLAETAQSGPILRKYPGRALILTGGACAANCRFCFRRHFRRDGGLFDGENTECDGDLRRRLEVKLGPLAGDRSLREVILSGSDPLGLPHHRLKILLNYIKTLSFVNRVRIHTRRPILLPNECFERFFSLWEPNEWPGKRVIFVFHINHRNEISPEVETFFRRLALRGVPLLSQTVLLSGVNDSVEALAELFEKLGDLGVIPYYLHQLDRVAGGAHFEVAPKRGAEIVEKLRQKLSGWLLPRYVQEIPGESAKTPIL